MRRVSLAVLLVVVLASAPAASSRPQIPASNGWIAFASNRDAGTGLYRLDPVGGRVTRIGSIAGRWPSWSPDGSLIAFSDHRLRLAVARADGTQVRVLTSRPIVAEQPAWSPDGSRIVFQHYVIGVGTGRDLSVVRADGTGRRHLTRALREDVQPAWSPDGAQIAFASNRGPGKRFSDWEIYVVRPDGGGVRALTRNVVVDQAPTWSPDGSLIAFQSGREPGRFNPELWTMRTDGTGERRVQPASGPAGFPVWSEQTPSWSPDGNWLVYVSNETNYPDNVFIVRPDGEDKTDLTPASSSFDLDPAWQPVCSHAGTPGRDVLRGTPADDRVCGYGGADVLTGGTGRDGVYGGDGNDSLRARDGSFDVVGCGSGRDEVVADRVDLVGVDCERIRRR